MVAHFGLAFASPPAQNALGSPLTLTRRLIKQKARHHRIAPALTPCKHIISGYYFTPLAAVLFTFPSRYLFTIGRQLVFRLTPWSAQIHTKFHVHRITQEIPRRAPVFGYGSFTLYGAAFQKLHLTFALPRRAPTTPDSFLRSVCSCIFDHHSWEWSDLNACGILIESLQLKAHE